MRRILRLCCFLIIMAGVLAAPGAPVRAAQQERSDAPEQKLVALTFDDGPGPWTGSLLDELEERGARASFFLFASKIDEDTAPLVERMAREGHCVASHTYNHARLTTLSNSQIWEELAKADEAIERVIGTTPLLIRPPFGAWDQRVLDAVGKPVILWSVDTRDWELHDPEIVCESILKNVKDGDIVLLHELELSSKDGVIAAVDIMMDEGYRFVTVPQLFELRGIPLEPGVRYYSAPPSRDENETPGGTRDGAG